MKKLILGIVLATSIGPVAMAQQTMTASGQVVSVRLVPRTFSVRDARAQEVIRYSVATGTPVTIAGGEARLGHLRAGDRVDVTYRRTDQGREATRIRVPEPTSALDQRVTEGLFSTISGEVVAVDNGQRTLTVVGDQSGERHSYSIPQGTRISISGENARIRDLQRGDNVTLRFREEGQQRQAARVRVPQTATPLAQRQARASSAAAQPAQPRQLPRTASPLPLLGFVGILGLIGSGALRLRRLLRRS